MKSVVVDPEYFSEVVFKGATPKDEFNADRNAPKVQKLRGGVPVWAVKCAVSVVAPNGRVDDDFITVTVPSDTDPAHLFRRGEDVMFDRLQFGVADTKTGYSLWFSADAIHPAAVSSAKSAA